MQYLLRNKRYIKNISLLNNEIILSPNKLSVKKEKFLSTDFLKIAFHRLSNRK